MPGITMQFDPDNPGVVKFADDELGLATAVGFECQVTSVALTPAGQTETNPGTLCRGESDIAKASKWTLDIEILQDWTDPAGASFFFLDNDAQQKWFSISYSADVAPVATGECSVQATQFLGAATGPLVGTASMPVTGKPVISKPTLSAMMTAGTASTA